MNQSIKSVIVLSVICLIVTSILAGVNFITATIIEENTYNEKMASLYEVLPDADKFEEITLTEDMPATVTGIYADTAGSGYAVTAATSSQYSKGDMLFTIGVDNNGAIVNIKLIQYTESKDFGLDYPSKYVGADEKNIADVETVGGVTYSSAAFKQAVTDALNALSTVKEEN